MTWAIEFERSAVKEFRKLDLQTQRRIRDFFRQRVLADDNPRSHGKALRGKQANLWRYRVGSYRVIAELQDEWLTILVLRVAHRSDAYR